MCRCDHHIVMCGRCVRRHHSTLCTSRRSNTRYREIPLPFTQLTHFVLMCFYECATECGGRALFGSIVHGICRTPCGGNTCAVYYADAYVSLSILCTLIVSLLGWLVFPHLCVLRGTCSCVQPQPLVRLEMLCHSLAQVQPQVRRCLFQQSQASVKVQHQQT